MKISTTFFFIYYRKVSIHLQYNILDYKEEITWARKKRNSVD